MNNGATERQFRQPRLDWYVAGATVFVAFIVYLLTVQRTVSFWDCGEFIACAAILGVPHPPGTPLFVLIGRLFSILPTAADISFRINLLSVVSGACAVGAAYMVAARLLRRWVLFDMEFWGKEVVVITSAFCAAALFGFAATVWSNHVEAEVYGITLFIFVTIIFAALVWVDNRYSALGARLLLFIAFISVLGLGVAMMVYLAVPGFWLVVLLLHENYRRDWRIWAAALALMLVVASGTEAFLWNLIFLLGIAGWWTLVPRSRTNALKGLIVPLWAIVLYFLFFFTIPISLSYWGTFDWIGTVLILAASFIGSFTAASEDAVTSRRRWGLLGGLMGVALLAFSLQLFIPIRSHQDPRIDENNPETWESFKGFLERKQYGQESMVERMFRRRGLWQNQLGRHPRMGFWGFFEEQYGFHGRAFLPLFIIGLLPFVIPFVQKQSGRDGPHSTWFPDRNAVYLYVFLTLFATTVGLVVYMNFADGVFYNPDAVDQAYLEVRDRDYFFTTGFALFGLCIGVGLGWLIGLLATRVRVMEKPAVAVFSAVALLVLPYTTVQANWFRNDRSRNFLPYDYAYNILMSCEENTLLFTNGDNDTFPVWCLQEAYNIRRDVKVVNLSLVNTDWYILQMKNQYGVPMNLTDRQIKTEPVRLQDGRIYGKPYEPYNDRFRGYKHDLVPYVEQGGGIVRVQDQMVEQIVLANNWKQPVQFSGPYQGETKLDLPQHLEAVGQNYRLVRQTASGMVDTAESRRLFEEVYQFRSWGDTTNYQDESAASLLWAYPEKMLQIAERYFRANDTATAIRLAEKAREVMPAYWRSYQYLSQLYGVAGRPVDSTRIVEKGISTLKYLRTVNPGNVLYVQSYAFVLENAGRGDEALRMLTETFDDRPKEELTFLTLARSAMNANRTDILQRIARTWLNAHPNDDRARQLLSMAPQARPPATPNP